MSNNKLYNIYEKFIENKMSHIFLIETNDVYRAYDDLKYIIANIIKEKDNYQVDDIINKMNEDNLLDFYHVEPDNNSIKKEHIEYIFNNCRSIPTYLSNKYYVINEAEKINVNCENRILKFIEEPLEGIYGFLICRDIKKLLPTIKSRCQIISAYYDNDLDDTFINDELLIEYVNKYENELDIIHNTILIKKLSERIEYIEFFNKLLKLYNLLLHKQLDLTNYDCLKKLNIKQICDRISLINNVIEKLGANCNIKLTINYYILELENKNE